MIWLLLLSLLSLGTWPVPTQDSQPGVIIDR